VKKHKNNKIGIRPLDLAHVTLWILNSIPNRLIHIFERKCNRSQYDNKMWGQNLGYDKVDPFLLQIWYQESFPEMWKQTLCYKLLCYFDNFCYQWMYCQTASAEDIWEGSQGKELELYLFDSTCWMLDEYCV
jgi:hypothetical protein